MEKVVVTFVGLDNLEGYEVYFNGWWVGTHHNAVGPYGDSEGIFRYAETTTPLTEYAEKNGFTLVDADGNPIPRFV